MITAFGYLIDTLHSGSAHQIRSPLKHEQEPEGKGNAFLLDCKKKSFSCLSHLQACIIMLKSI